MTKTRNNTSAGSKNSATVKLSWNRRVTIAVPLISRDSDLAGSDCIQSLFSDLIAGLVGQAPDALLEKLSNAILQFNLPTCRAIVA
jgi:hypothetical protein